VAGAGRKIWTQETLAVADLQDYLQDQVVPRFASAAARSAAIPTPTEGMFSTLDDTDMTYRHDGTRWRKIAGPTEQVVSNFYGGQQAATVAASTNVWTRIGTVAIPAHNPGTLQVECAAPMTPSGAPSAAFAGFIIGSAPTNGTAYTAVPWLARSLRRIYAGSVANVAHDLLFTGHIASDGTSKTLDLYMSADAASSGSWAPAGGFVWNAWV
jgi:hypothetical protein